MKSDLFAIFVAFCANPFRQPEVKAAKAKPATPPIRAELGTGRISPYEECRYVLQITKRFRTEAHEDHEEGKNPAGTSRSECELPF